MAGELYIILIAAHIDNIARLQIRRVNIRPARMMPVGELYTIIEGWGHIWRKSRLHYIGDTGYIYRVRFPNTYHTCRKRY